MSNLKFKFEWADSQGANVPEFRATWASLSIEVDGNPITRLIDHHLHTTRDQIFLPLYPLGEWIVLHWWNLLFESRMPERPVASSYQFRHNLRYAREGYAIPDLSIDSLGEYVKVAWHNEKLANYRIEFFTNGEAWVVLGEVKEEFSRLIDAIVKRLHEHGIHDSLLEQEWTSILSADEEERQFCIAAARLGVNPYEVSEEEQQAILDVGAVLPASIAEDFFHVADYNRIGEQWARLATDLEQIKASDAGSSQLLELRNTVTILHVPVKPWQEGYAYAKALRSYLGIDDMILGSLKDLGQALHLSESEAESSVRESSLSYVFDALVAFGRLGSPVFLVGKKREDAKRFAFCRALFEFLNARNGAPRMVTRAYTEHQRRNRAFAAEFLAPESMIRTRIHGDTIDEESIQYIADEFGVSFPVIEHQIDNHRLAEIIR